MAASAMSTPIYRETQRVWVMYGGQWVPGTIRWRFPGDPERYEITMDNGGIAYRRADSIGLIRTEEEHAAWLLVQ